MPDSANSSTPKPAQPWVAIIGFCALLAASVYLIWDHWGFLHPTDGATAWIAIGAYAAALGAISTVGLAAFAFRGLRSLTIARDEIVHRALRDAKLCAILRLEEVAKELVPLNTGVLNALAADGVAIFLSPNDVVTFEPDPTDLKAANAWLATLSVETYNLIVTFLNRMEAWSVYFTTGVADPDVAFGPIAPLLRSWVGQYYALLLILRSGVASSSGKFPNLIQLHMLWSAQMDTEQLARMHKDISGQMEQAQARIARAKLQDVIPRMTP